MIKLGMLRRSSGLDAAAFIAAAALTGAWLTPVAAESVRLDCGSEPAASVGDAGSAWYNLYSKRLSLVIALRQNGNTDLATFFEACSAKALQRAAELGHLESEYQFGIRIALREPRTKESMDEGYVWIRRAADRGHPRAKVMIATWGPRKP